MFKREMTETIDGQNGKKKRRKKSMRSQGRTQKLLCDLCEQQEAMCSTPGLQRRSVGGEAGGPEARGGEDITLQTGHVWGRFCQTGAEE